MSKTNVSSRLFIFTNNKINHSFRHLTKQCDGNMMFRFRVQCQTLDVYSPCTTPWDWRKLMGGYRGGRSSEVQDGRQLITWVGEQLKKKGRLYLFKYQIYSTLLTRFFHLDCSERLTTKWGVEETQSLAHCLSNSPVLTTSRPGQLGTRVHRPEGDETTKPSWS